MKFLLDHDVPERIAEVMAHSGLAVERLRDVLPRETLDDAVLEFSLQNERVLVTCNRDDFLNLAKTQAHHGLVILIRRKSRVAECAALLKLIAAAGEAGLTRNINFA